MVGRLREVDVASLGDGERVAQGLRELAELRRHLGRGLEIELIPVVAQALLVGHVLAGADAQEDIVRAVIRLSQVVHVVRADEGKPEIGGDRRQPAVHHPLVVDAVVLHLEEEVVGTQDVPEGPRRLPRAVRTVAAEVGGDLSLEATAESDEAAGVLVEQVLVDARLGVEPLGVARGDELDEVVVARPVGCQQHQVVGGLPRDAASAEAAAVGDVDLAADDGLDPPRACLVVEGDGREEIPVLGDGHRGHSQGLDLIQHLSDAAGAVEERELGVQVEVHELGGLGHRRRSVATPTRWWRAASS